MFAQARQIERAATHVRARLDYQVRLRLGNDLLEYPQVERTLGSGGCPASTSPARWRHRRSTDVRIVLRSLGPCDHSWGITVPSHANHPRTRSCQSVVGEVSGRETTPPLKGREVARLGRLPPRPIQRCTIAHRAQQGRRSCSCEDGTFDLTARCLWRMLSARLDVVSLPGEVEPHALPLDGLATWGL
jgi:hypothetical protein